jgi:hypothetical protein
LPLAFLGDTVREVLETPFPELIATPGVGQKKIASLLNLLNRIATAPMPDPQAGLPVVKEVSPSGVLAIPPGDPGFDAAQVPEALWEQWRASIVRHNLGQETLGRFARSLQDLPRVVWSTPLETYTKLRLSDIRSLKTHGEKRVRVIVEIFGVLHRMLGSTAPVDYLRVQLWPKFIKPIDAWITEVLNRDLQPDAKEIRRSFVEPLMAQVRIDAGDTIARLAEGRLGLVSNAGSVRQAAKRMGLTRARVYQLLNEVSAIMAVRWPEGHLLVTALRDRLHEPGRDDRDLEMFDTAVDLFFPSRRRLSEMLSSAASGGNGRLSHVGLGHQRAG